MELSDLPEEITPGDLRALANQLESLTCTGLTATWCPTHGNCACPGLIPFAERTLDSDECPLHNDQSSHAVQGDGT